MTQSAAALVIRDADNPPKIETITVGEPGPGEVAVRMTASGICGSDLHVLNGKSAALSYPMVLGHEGSGTIAALGPGVVDRRVGDPVVITSVDPCYRCQMCLSGGFYHCLAQPPVQDRLCLDGAALPTYADVGSLSEYAVVAANRTVPVPPDLDLALLATTGCGVLTGLGTVLNLAPPEPGASVLVIGCGGVGLNVVQGARLAGAATIIAVDTNADRLELAGRFGATHVVNAATQDVASAVFAVAPVGVDIAYEVVGSTDLVAQALELTRKMGTCVMVGAAAPTSELRLPPRLFMLTERKLTGSFMGHSLPQRDIPKIVELYRQGRIMLDELVGDRLPFAEWEAGFAATESGTVARCLLTFED